MAVSAPVKTSRLSVARSMPNRMMALDMPIDASGMIRLAGLREQVGVAEFSRSKHAGIEGNEQKNKHLRAEGADCKDQRVGEQLFILVHTAVPFPFI